MDFISQVPVPSFQFRIQQSTITIVNPQSQSSIHDQNRQSTITIANLQSSQSAIRNQQSAMRCLSFLFSISSSVFGQSCLRRRDKARSDSSRPPVWHVAQ